MSRRRKRVEEEEHENHERWAVSYSDMMTVLMALFLVLYAISTVDQTKYEELARSLSTDESPTFVNGLLARILSVKPSLAL